MIRVNYIQRRDNTRKKKEVAGIEAAYEFVEDVENKMSKIGDVIRGMDKRMSYNLRLVGSVIASDFKELDQMKKEDEAQNAEPKAAPEETKNDQPELNAGEVDQKKKENCQSR